MQPKLCLAPQNHAFLQIRPRRKRFRQPPFSARPCAIAHHAGPSHENHGPSWIFANGRLRRRGRLLCWTRPPFNPPFPPCPSPPATPPKLLPPPPRPPPSPRLPLSGANRPPPTSRSKSSTAACAIPTST